MKFANKVGALSYGLSQMAQTHKNDVISNALAALADKLSSKGENLTTKMLTDTEKQLIAYYHSNKKA
jgi:hypothetical protein